MRIVSQNRELSLEFSQYEIWVQSNIIYGRIGTDSKLLGVYASPERAKEVFEDIHKAYAPVSNLSDNLTEEQTQQDYVYYMPET